MSPFSCDRSACSTQGHCWTTLASQACQQRCRGADSHAQGGTFAQGHSLPGRMRLMGRQ